MAHLKKPLGTLGCNEQGFSVILNDNMKMKLFTYN